MFLATLVVSIVLAVALAASTFAKLTRDERVTASLTGIGVPLSWFPFLGACELAGAVGLVIGLFFAPLGIAAAIGVILYFIGAVIAHLRAGDKALGPPLFLLALGVAALLLRIASL